MSVPALHIDGLSGGYGGVTVIRDMTFSVEPGEIVALLGANGAGKTTTLLLASGLLPLRSGTVKLKGELISGQRPQKLPAKGLTLVPDDRGLFTQLTVAENLRLARRRKGALSQSEVLEIFPALGEMLDRRVVLLSGGEQQMLALAKALTTSPDVLLIDEMSMGLAPIIVENLFDTVRRFSVERGIATVLVEQHVDLALRAADRGIVIERGRVKFDSPARELLTKRDVLQKAYLSSPDTNERAL